MGVLSSLSRMVALIRSGILGELSRIFLPQSNTIVWVLKISLENTRGYVLSISPAIFILI